MEAIRVLIVEDEPLIAENIAMYLNNHDFTVSGIAT
jgi:DNA-binding response OmpR family regulator